MDVVYVDAAEYAVREAVTAVAVECKGKLVTGGTILTSSRDAAEETAIAMVMVSLQATLKILALQICDRAFYGSVVELPGFVSMEEATSELDLQCLDLVGAFRRPRFLMSIRSEVVTAIADMLEVLTMLSTAEASQVMAPQGKDLAPDE
ncbi:hypothetical protein HPB47_003745 [Ixodes persulcatus]|uniref:Uncharacterized protein n=1 Tax=Ixodes persulcatus TaxID=34615 RepID=A0AC60PJ06_IXOPE|nr:hypothetical protein HPB47_003745 [Ixodes persulcatus]